MKQVVQDIKDGRTEVRELPDPVVGQHDVVIRNSHSLISQGTERYVVSLARQSLIGKARSRPDHVKRVWQKIKSEGIVSTAQQVSAKLKEPMALGYSSAGVVLGTGSAVDSVKPGERVASAGPHASIVSIGELLCARVPEGVPMNQACFSGVAAISLQGIRLADVQLGSSVLVIGLGLIGQLTVAMLKASGCRVFGTDLDPAKVEMAKKMGADAAEVGEPLDAIMAFSGGGGVDATLVTAATPNSAPIIFGAECTRLRGHLICVGLVGLDLPRPPFFAKELRFAVSGSFGPGRGVREYEEMGRDYPPGIERWTAQRNMAAFMDALANGMDITPLLSKEVALHEVEAQYDSIVKGEAKGYGYVIAYGDGDDNEAKPRITFKESTADGELGIGVVGAGNFARLGLLPNLKRIAEPPFKLRAICSAHGLNAASSGEADGFDYATADIKELMGDDRCKLLFLTTRHNLHAEQTSDAIAHGKHVYVEKPLALSHDELAGIERRLAEQDSATVLMVGFNRRFTEGSRKLREHFGDQAPLTIQYRFAAGPVPDDSWLHDPEVGGGRILSEACHPIDWCIYLAQSPVTRVYAESIAAQGRKAHIEGSVNIVLRHANGSLSTVLYEDSGSRAMPTERIEAFGGGRSASLENWRDLNTYAGDDRNRDKLPAGLGHKASFAAFLNAVRSPGTDPEQWPIPLSHILNGAEATLAAVVSLHEGRPVDLEG
ncbi:MAG: bi-domain-containing oxidoreductase [Pseudomonadota bacterium]